MRFPVDGRALDLLQLVPIGPYRGGLTAVHSRGGGEHLLQRLIRSAAQRDKLLPSEGTGNDGEPSPRRNDGRRTRGHEPERRGYCQVAATASYSPELGGKVKPANDPLWPAAAGLVSGYRSA